MTTYEREVLSRVKKAIHAIEPAAELILFGSRSRGEADNDSDFDILMNTEREASMSYELMIQEVIYDIELEMDVLIEIFLFSKQSWIKGLTPSPLIESVRREGTLI